MLNRPAHVFTGDDTDEPWSDADARPVVRLVCVFALLVLPLAAVVGRVAWLQAGLAADFVAGFGRFTEIVEPLPARDGRILSQDGRVLASDVERYAIAAHYRWIEEPADPLWLRRQALSRLGPAERRDPERVLREEAAAAERRGRMWQRLASTVGTSESELKERRAAVRERVERIVALVEEKRASSKVGGRSDGGSAADAEASQWQTLWKCVREALTTPPGRTIREPLVVREELEYHPLIEEVPPEVAAEIESRPDLYPGLRVETVARRIYPAGELAAHVVGTRTPASDDELARRRADFPDGDPLDYRPGDRTGKSGVERAYERELRGLRGLRRVVRDRTGEVVKVETVREPRPGQDVIVTLHLDLQQRLETTLDAVLAAPRPDGRLPAGGAIVVLDVRTGDVVAAASGPRPNLAELAGGSTDAWQETLADPRRPLVDRPVQMAIPPGSVFKPVTAVALIESGRFDPDERCPCHGYFGSNPNRNRCYHSVSHGDIDLGEALARSCNVYFFSAAERVGPQEVVNWADHFGIGRKTGIDLPGERAGNLPRLPARDARPKQPWYPGDTLGLVIGQSRLTTTPLQIARMMAAVANGGRLVTPRVVSRVGSVGSGESATPARDADRIPGLSDETLARIRRGLERVVEDPHGTGYKTVRTEGVRIAGKTGTAETGGGRPDHAWFAGYVPADHPRYAFAVVLEHAGSGGQTAGPVARTLVEALVEYGLVRPDQRPVAARR